MKVIRCGGCGAPFSDAPEDTAVRCDYCGVANEPTLLRAPRPDDEPNEGPEPPAVHVQHVVIDARHLRRPAAAAGGVLTLVVLVTVVGSLAAAGWAVWTGMRAAFPDRVPRIPGETRWTPGNLRDFTSALPRPVDVAPPRGGLARFDPVAEIAWATAIARAWSADARLERIDATRIRPDGVVDLAADAQAEVTYRFVSPGRVADYFERTDEGKAPAHAPAFWLLLRRGQPLVRVLDARPSRDTAPPSPDGVLTLADTFARAGKRLPARPLYNGYFIHVPVDGWTWYLSSLSGRDSLPRVRATDGRVR